MLLILEGRCSVVIENIFSNTCEFSCLQDLDMSYNNLSTEDVLMLGVLLSLRVLNISGNNLSKLSEDMSYPASVSGANIQSVFCKQQVKYDSCIDEFCEINLILLIYLTSC